MAFAAPHQIVTDLTRLYNWVIALEYDIQQRELVSPSPSHDLSTLDQQALTLIVTWHLIQSAQNQALGSFHSRLKHAAPDAAPNTPCKQPRLCFGVVSQDTFQTTAKLSPHLQVTQQHLLQLE